ncbi:MAG TPA: cation:proton antiporter, partial [Acidilobales archaeon]|nr:cation:proton antiporter [Acidilobales archaeon]
MPHVIGELLAGVILGPSLLGLINPLVELEVLATVGVIFFMLSAGFEVDLNRLMRTFKEGLIVAVMGVVFPFTLGLFLGYKYSMGFTTSFALATCLSITAIGLSVRVFMDLGMLSSRIGLTVINAAVDDDVIGLVLMSVAFTLVSGGKGLHEVFITFLTSSSFLIVGFMIGVLIASNYRFRHLLRGLILRIGRSLPLRLTIIISIAFLFGYLARLSGLHEIIGVFIAGIILNLLIGIEERAEREIIDFTFAFFALLFFAYIGIKTDLRTLAGMTWFTVELIFLAFLGKFVGGLLGSIIARLNIREAMVVGIAMNSRAAVELVIANAFFALGVFSKEILTALVIMAAITSLTTPVLLRLSVHLLKISHSPKTL